VVQKRSGHVVELSLPNIIAHRGAPRYVAENTIASLKKAHELGANWVEFDVMLSKDGVPVIMHDSGLNRTTNGKGKLRDYTYAELARLDAGDGQKIPTFEEWLKTAKQLEMGINVEIKESASNADEVVDKIHKLLSENWSQDLPKPLISSATFACVEAYRRLDGDAHIAYIVDWLPFTWKSKLASIEACAIVMNYKKLTQKKVERLHRAGYKVLAFTVNDATEYSRLINMGVDGCFTDDLKTVRGPDVAPLN
jgi:glycerophosphoryl diester phosphodiesterase